MRNLSRHTPRLVVAQMIVAIAAALLPLSHHAQAQTADPSSERWEATIVKFEENDRQQPPPEAALLFTGSSTVVHWRTLADDFAFAPVINRGFGGSQVSDLLAYVERVVIAYKPRVVVVYSGDNDINAGKTPERVLADFATLQARIHAALPETRLVIVGPKLSPRRWHLTEAFRAVNAGLAQWAAQIDGVEVFDICDLMLGADGLPRAELYSDGLHLTPEGYAVWTAYLEPRLRAVWQQALAADPTQ
ncbi:MAG: GDSL-type esterase/lipase family protein [Armatimonadota bacterium]|jgi:lysophospholipase L1-like esterase